MACTHPESAKRRRRRLNADGYPYEAVVCRICANAVALAGYHRRKLAKRVWRMLATMPRPSV